MELFKPEQETDTDERMARRYVGALLVLEGFRELRLIRGLLTAKDPKGG